jgi:hypothetical protein
LVVKREVEEATEKDSKKSISPYDASFLLGMCMLLFVKRDRLGHQNKTRAKT